MEAAAAQGIRPLRSEFFIHFLSSQNGMPVESKESPPYREATTSARKVWLIKRTAR